MPNWFELIPQYLNIFINILTVFIVIYFIYNFFTQLHLEKEFNEKNVTDLSDLDSFNEDYKDTNLCKFYTSLDDREKEYLYHVINFYRLRYKNEKPKITKQINNVKSQLFNNMLITLLIKQKFGAAFDSLKHNALLNFITFK